VILLICKEVYVGAVIEVRGPVTWCICRGEQLKILYLSIKLALNTA